MNPDSSDTGPQRVRVAELVSSRYPPNHTRPLSWDERVAGVDVIKTDDGRTLKLWCDGQQSPPKSGWVLMLKDKKDESAYRWTLYGMGRNLQH